MLRPSIEQPGDDDVAGANAHVYPLPRRWVNARNAPHPVSIAKRFSAMALLAYNRLGGKLIGIDILLAEATGKRLELLLELVPAARSVPGHSSCKTRDHCLRTVSRDHEHICLCLALRPGSHANRSAWKGQNRIPGGSPPDDEARMQSLTVSHLYRERQVMVNPANLMSGNLRVIRRARKDIPTADCRRH
jgi:hypothetical protein